MKCHFAKNGRGPWTDSTARPGLLVGTTLPITPGDAKAESQRPQLLARRLTISGISSGADFAIQFSVAHSNIVAGVAAFAGIPYHCDRGPFNRDPYHRDLCKSKPHRVNVSDLVSLTHELESTGAISPVTPGVTTAFVYLFWGGLDPFYRPGSVANTRDYYLGLGLSASHVAYVEMPEAGHAVPTLDYGDPCGTTGRGTKVLQLCGYDGAGQALAHLLGPSPGTRGSFELSLLLNFSQVEHCSDAAAQGKKLASQGAVAQGSCIYPSPAANREPRSAAFIFPSMDGRYGLQYVKHSGFNQWAEARRLAVLYPQLHRTRRSKIQGIACWDSYGDSGEAYCTQSGPQVTAVKSMADAFFD
eukprot:gene11361-2068_t